MKKWRKFSFNHQKSNTHLICSSGGYLTLLHPAGDVLWVFVEPGNVVP